MRHKLWNTVPHRCACCAAVLPRTPTTTRSSRSSSTAEPAAWARVTVAMAEPFPLEPERQALLVVDLQNDFVREGAPQEVPDARATFRPSRPSSTPLPRAPSRWSSRAHRRPQRTLFGLVRPSAGPRRAPAGQASPAYRDGPRPRATGDRREVEPRPGDVRRQVRLRLVPQHGARGCAARPRRAPSRSVGTVTQICVEETVREGFRRGFEMIVAAETASPRSTPSSMPRRCATSG